MRIGLLLGMLVLTGGCATTENGLPTHAPPFSADRPIRFPEVPTGSLAVRAFPKDPHSTRPGTTAAWRLYDVDGRPLGSVRRDDESLVLPQGEYVVMAKDEHGRLRTAQVVVRAGQTTQLPLKDASQAESNALNVDKLEE